MKQTELTPPAAVTYLSGAWEDAFLKFGYDDGDGFVETDLVAKVLAHAGYEVHIHEWGLHNTVIDSLTRDSVELIPGRDSTFRFGYDDPRDYLPQQVVSYLDRSIVGHTGWH
ncbi:MAG: hypothetical protein KDA93_24380 [Planctomycetaceae bacterium]|nr:hypothetical protein [Planctomycetaceae bacterium]